MPMITQQRQLFEQGASPDITHAGITIGIVVDVNDPQEMGRVRVLCPKWGDSWSAKVEDLPWAIYTSPIAGQTQNETRGPGIQTSKGGLAYGMWAIPKVGTHVLVCCIDGNPMTRSYIGCLYDQFTSNTLPHGRFMYEDHPALEKTSSTAPYGPFTTTEQPIEPLTTNLNKAFGTGKRHEFATRGSDFTVSSVSLENLAASIGSVADDDGVDSDDWTNTQGYQMNRGDPGTDGDRKFESQVMSLTSPGFHSLSMDDRQENCRIRIRTTSGHQIIMDDTNERIYVSTAAGNNWIELDQAGNIDMYTTGNFSVNADGDINFNAGGSIRMKAKKDVSIVSDTNIGLNAKTDINVTAGHWMNLNASRANFKTNLFNVKAVESLILDSSRDLGVKAEMTLMLTGTAICQTSESNTTNVDIDRGSTMAAPDAHDVPKEQPTVPSRIPKHEPWARTMTKSDTSIEPELPYDSKDVGRVERGRRISRGMFWRR